MTLSVELGDPPHLPAHSHQSSRNGPARQRQPLRRELACDNAMGEEATSTVDVEMWLLQKQEML